MRPFDEAGAEVLRELAAVDAALAGRPVPAELADLEELTRQLRTERPVPPQRFAADLDALVERDFELPAEAEGTGVRGRMQRFLREPQRSLPLALAGAASVFIVAVALVSSGALFRDGGTATPGGTVTTPGQTPAVREAAPPSSAPSTAPGTSAPSAAAGKGKGKAAGSAPRGTVTTPGQPPAALEPAPPSSTALGRPLDTGLAPGARNRKVERQASLTLATAPGQVEKVADRAIATTDRYRGIVLSSTVSSGDGSDAGATLDLRVPSSRLQPALADLSKLAHIRSRTQSTQDVTAAYRSLRSRLGVALAERSSLLRQLARASTANETASVRARLRLADQRISRLRGALRTSTNRVYYAAVSVAVEADSTQGGGHHRWTPGDALGDAVSVLGTAAGVALVSLAVLIPLVALALLAAFGRRLLLRSRRERALDSSAGIENAPPG